MTLKKIDYESLAYFAAAGPEKSVPRPKGLGGVGLTNFIKRGWIERYGRDGKSGEQLYRITFSGLKFFAENMASD
jgi:hypothetical protein